MNTLFLPKQQQFWKAGPIGGELHEEKCERGLGPESWTLHVPEATGIAFVQVTITVANRACDQLPGFLEANAQRLV